MGWAIVLAAIALAAYVFILNERTNARIQETDPVVYMVEDRQDD